MSSYIDDPIAEKLAAGGEQEALVTAEQVWTYAALDRWVQAVEGRLLAAGCRPGDVVGVDAPRGPQLVALLWALWRTGSIAVPLNTRHPVSRRVQQARRAGAKHLVAEADRAADASDRIDTRGLSVLPFESLTEKPGEQAQAASTDTDTGQPRVDLSLRATQLPLTARATAVFTSGSTGRPKLAVHTFGNHVFSARGSAANIPLGFGDRWLLSLPLYHVGGLAILFRCALAGATVTVPSPNDSLVEAIDRLRPTHLSLVATQLKRLLETEVDLPELSAILLGGSAIPASLLDRARERGWPVHTSYGSTEMASQITATPPNADRETLATSGRCLPHRIVRIVDGEIRVGGKVLFAGYAGEEGAAGPLRSGRDDHGYFRMGDLGFLDEQQRLHVTGRMDRLIISGGENIQPEEIESALRVLDGVVRAAVVGIPDDEFGERPVAFVEQSSDVSASGSVADLREQLRSVLPGYKVPDAVHPMPQEAVEGRMKVDYEYLESTARKLRQT